jgi:hypothetical protein
MADTSLRNDGLDLRMVDDPGVRQALRALHQQVIDALNKQQQQIDALVDLLVEKNLTSLGELKRQMLKMQQNLHRSERIHTAMAGTAGVPTAAAPPPGMHAVVR